jgi:hypothetical protein
MKHFIFSHILHTPYRRNAKALLLRGVCLLLVALAPLPAAAITTERGLLEALAAQGITHGEVDWLSVNSSCGVLSGKKATFYDCRYKSALAQVDHARAQRACRKKADNLYVYSGSTSSTIINQSSGNSTQQSVTVIQNGNGASVNQSVSPDGTSTVIVSQEKPRYKRASKSQRREAFDSCMEDAGFIDSTNWRAGRY